MNKSILEILLDDISFTFSRINNVDFEIQEEIRKIDLTLDRLNKLTCPRAEFNSWRDSKEGKEWKQQNYKLINGICPSCKNQLDIKYFDIDHVVPISKLGNAANNLSNYRLLCSPCNKRKSGNSMNNKNSNIRETFFYCPNDLHTEDILKKWIKGEEAVPTSVTFVNHKEEKVTYIDVVYKNSWTGGRHVSTDPGDVDNQGVSCVTLEGVLIK